MIPYVDRPYEPVPPENWKNEYLSSHENITDYNYLKIPEGATHVTAETKGCEMYGYDVEVTFHKTVLLTESEKENAQKVYEKACKQYKKDLVKFEEYEKAVAAEQQQKLEVNEKATYLRLKKKYDKT